MWNGGDLGMGMEGGGAVRGGVWGEGERFAVDWIDGGGQVVWLHVDVVYCSKRY